MGEWSKSIGEKGERIVKFLFEEILGVNSMIENSSIECNKGEKHKNGNSIKVKTSHGLDGLFYYRSPLEDKLLDTVIVSSKFIDGEYPTNPKTLFKKHFEDLAFTLECFKNSKEQNEINQKFYSIEKGELLGVLVWLSNKDDLNYDLNSKVDNFLISSELNFHKIVLVDNKRINFLFESIYRSKEVYGMDNVDYVYHNSSLNNNSRQTTPYGKIFPINYLYSDIIQLRVERDQKVIFVIFVNDDFSHNAFSQILSYATNFDHLTSVGRIMINFKTYDKLVNDNEVKDVLSKFSKYKLNDNLVLNNFPNNFRSQ